ncbi:hypothetical protein CBR_g19485 [Chara braunii]|uniref:Uncharacterized protein n=1 Tax=Chara braunii TaxID=69332 RepID=A0A388KYB7_CHABU|nr:hypothetical protein CBR_g19485 [Chara braunii]|eukprot:GBG74972.1 hypothetical protein CBR_g19485 [Chara braunii]
MEMMEMISQRRGRSGNQLRPNDEVLHSQSEAGRRRAKVASSTASSLFFSFSLSLSFALALLVIGPLFLLTSAAAECPPRNCTSPTLGGGIPCPPPLICVYTELGRPEVDIPHTGHCVLPSYCQVSGEYFAVGLNGIPSADGCNTCGCSRGGILGCTEIACLSN